MILKLKKEKGVNIEILIHIDFNVMNTLNSLTFDSDRATIFEFIGGNLWKKMKEKKKTKKKERKKEEEELVLAR